MFKKLHTTLFLHAIIACCTMQSLESSITNFKIFQISSQFSPHKNREVKLDRPRLFVEFMYDTTKYDTTKKDIHDRFHQMVDDTHLKNEHPFEHKLPFDETQLPLYEPLRTRVKYLENDNAHIIAEISNLQLYHSLMRELTHIKKPNG